MKNTSIIIFTFLSFFAVNTVKGQYSYEFAPIESVGTHFAAPLPWSISMPSFRTNRPTSSKTSYTVYRYFYYLDSGITINEAKKGQLNGNMEFRIGISERIELNARFETFSTNQTDKHFSNQAGDLRLKYNIIGNNYSSWLRYYNISLLGGIGLTNNQTSVNETQVSWLFLSDFSPFYEDINFTINAGYSQNPISRLESGYLISLKFQPDQFFEYILLDDELVVLTNYTLFTKTDRVTQILELGIAYIHWQRWQADLNVGTAFKESPIFIELGFSKRFWKYD